MSNPIREIDLQIEGLGIIMYSQHSVEHIREGEDYLSNNYWDPDKGVEHIYQGSIVGFCTGTPGDFHLQIFEGYPSNKELKASEFKLRLGIEIRGGRMFFRDLYELMEWNDYCPVEQLLELEDGFYHITLLSSPPESGILGDYQEIYVYLNKLPKMPELKYSGVPMLCE